MKYTRRLVLAGPTCNGVDNIDGLSWKEGQWTSRRVKLRNRRVILGHNQRTDEYCLDMVRLVGEEVTTTRMRLTKEAMEAVVDLYFDIKLYHRKPNGKK